jgi:CRP/FNR family transcriptional regulator
MDKIEFLRNTPLFASCSDKSLESIADLTRLRQFKAGDKIIREGSESTVGFYILLEGEAKASRGDHDLAEYAPGDYFGEIALLVDDIPRTATVSATSDASVLALTRWDFRALLKTNPEIAVGVMSMLAQRLAATDQALSE